MSCEIAWLSVDPVRRKVDFYPRSIAQRIEKSYNERGARCLGSLGYAWDMLGIWTLRPASALGLLLRVPL